MHFANFRRSYFIVLKLFVCLLLFLLYYLNIYIWEGSIVPWCYNNGSFTGRWTTGKSSYAWILTKGLSKISSRSHYPYSQRQNFNHRLNHRFIGHFLDDRNLFARHDVYSGYSKPDISAHFYQVGIFVNSMRCLVDARPVL